MGGNPKSSILMGFSFTNHPAIGVPPFMEPRNYLMNQLSNLINYLGVPEASGSATCSGT